MAGVIKKPEPLNLSGNLNEFVMSSSGLVSFTLKKGDDILLQQSYEPGPDNLIRVDVKDVVENQLVYTLNTEQPFYIQNKLVETFVAIIDDASYKFRVIRGGVANLAETADNWLNLHFLTWQPRVKSVTYYSPEWLTYYAVEDCIAKLKAVYPDKSTKVITLGTCVADQATTMNLQYSVVSGKLRNTYPSYYEIWTEKLDGTKLSESQVYAFSDILSEDEQWYLFENSLGGLDTFRAYGSNNLNAEHDHSIAEFGEIREEYQVDTQRKYVKNTGYLDEYSRRWLLDFFPSKAKFVYEATAIRKIVVTESNVTYVSNELPSSYTFTWQLAEVSSFLNLVKNSNDIPDNLVAPDLSSPDFILPPRLAEFPRVILSEGVLIPAFDPFNPKPTVTTYGAIHNTIKNAVVKELEDEIGNIGDSGGSSNLEIIESTDTESVPSDTNLYSALKAKNEDDKRLRKDIEDFAQELINFLKGTKFGEFIPGILTGKGGMIDAFGNGELESLIIRRFLEVPEIRFNRVEVFTGIKWNAPGGGIIESVDVENRIAKLKLEDGEFGAISVGDICMGIFHSLTPAENSTEDKDDSKGGFTFAGFYTAYFTVTEILDKENKTFKYHVRPSSSSYPHEFHPTEAMHFVAYGNFVNKDRQTSNYSTRTYTRYLYHVDGWEFEKRQIAAQFGDLTNLSIHGYNMTGYSIFLNNIYMTGVINQMSADGTSVERVPFFKGAWSQGKYAYYDEVTHNGSSWLSINTGGTTSEPADGNPDWFKRVSKGEDGKDGTSAETVGDWISTREYKKSNIVRCEGASFIASADNIGIKPIKNPGGFLTSAGKYLITGGKRLYTGDPDHPWKLLSEDGKPGKTGLPGEKGKDGVQYYTWLKYADDAQGNGMSEVPTGKKYVGLAVNQLSPLESDDPSLYSWALIVGEGIPGKPGTDGKTLYTWMRYADDAQGNGMSNEPDGKKYVGLAYNKEMSTESNNPADYKWSKIEGDPGEAGLNYIIEPYNPYREYQQRDLVSFNGGKIFCKKKNIGQTPVPFLTTGGKYLKTGDSYLLYKPLTTGNINSEYWDIFIPPTVIEPVEKEFTTYHTSQSKPARPILTGNCAGWSQTIMTGARWKSTKKAISDAAGSWSDPVQYSAEDGKPGTDATAYWLVSPVTNIVFNSVGTPTPSAFTVSCKQQTGSGSVVACDKFYLTVRKSVTGTSGWEQHVAPVKSPSVNVTVIAGIKAYLIRVYEKQADALAWNSNYVDEAGVSVIRDGVDGERGATGSMPRNCGYYDQSKAPYYWNEQYRDIILHPFGNINYIFQVRNYSPGQGVSVPPTSQNGDTNWEPANKLGFVALDTALIDGADIAGFLYKNKKMQSRDIDSATGEPNLLLDGKTGEIISNKGIFKGSIGTPFVWREGGGILDISKNFNIAFNGLTETLYVKLPVDAKYNGIMCQILNPPIITKLGQAINISLVDGNKIWNTGETWTTYKTNIDIPSGKMGRFYAIITNDETQVNWYLDNYRELTM